LSGYIIKSQKPGDPSFLSLPGAVISLKPRFKGGEYAIKTHIIAKKNPWIVEEIQQGYGTVFIVGIINVPTLWSAAYP
jgi:hypothetical protein